MHSDDSADASDDALSSLIEAQRAFFATGATRGLAFRRRQLDRLTAAIQDREADIIEALHQDLGRPTVDAYISEVGTSLSEVRYARKNVHQWMRPERRGLPFLVWPATAHVHREPLGVSLILGAWNYPFYLLLAPLVGSIAGGNCALLKASELAPHSSRVITSLIRETFEPEYIAAVEGDRSLAERLLRERFDYIFFTGSSGAGRAVMSAAAQHLTPVTLELGGKSPCIVFADARLEVAARRIAWGKFLNAGQTCVAPDYVLVERSVHDQLVDGMRRAVSDFYGPNYGSIVNQRHFERLIRMLDDGQRVCGGVHDSERRYIEPTILTNVAMDSPVMSEEIFGPILPVITFDSLEDALAIVRSRPTPLALYCFTEDRIKQKRVVAESQSGGVCLNDVVVHMISCKLPFGGVGMSGMGNYHGRASFETFTQPRIVMRRGTVLDPSARYPNAKLSLPWARRLFNILLRE